MLGGGKRGSRDAEMHRQCDDDHSSSAGDGSGVQGYAKISVSIVPPGKSLKTFHDVMDDTEEVDRGALQSCSFSVLASFAASISALVWWRQRAAVVVVIARSAGAHPGPVLIECSAVPTVG